jgi:hypothetical protein
MTRPAADTPRTRKPSSPHEPGPKRRGSEHAGEKARDHEEDLLDEGLEETFPCSDPVSIKKVN